VLYSPLQVANAEWQVAPLINGGPWVAQFEQARDQKMFHFRYGRFRCHIALATKSGSARALAAVAAIVP
jgi:hypothetical protein